MLSGIRLIALDTTDSLEARALSYKTDLNHIFTNSWGPFDDGKRYEGAGPLLRAAMEQSVKQGRGGKGTIYVWAGGNGRRANDTVTTTVMLINVTPLPLVQSEIMELFHTTANHVRH